MIEKFYTMSQVCDTLQLSHDTITRMIHDKKITAAKFGKDWRFPESALKAYIASRTLIAITLKKSA